MSRFRIGTLVFLMTALAASATAQGQGSVPRVLRFDGVAAAGTAGPVSATLAVFDAAEGGAPLWEETQVLQVDAQGRYAVLVGAGRAEGVPPDVLASAAPRWLEVRFAGQATPASRVLLTSVPYALRASDADTLGGLPASAFVRVPGAGVATGRNGRPVSSPASTSGPRVNSGTPGYLGMFSNAVDLVSSNIFQLGQRVGVGNTSPFDAMHVAFTDAIGALTGYAVQNLSGSANAYSGMLFYDQNGALAQFQGFNNTSHEYRINNIAAGGSINFMLGSATRFLVRSDGDIQISGNMRKGADYWMHELGGGFNTALGRQALSAITVNGSTNTAIGFQSMLAATNAASNVAAGYGSLRATTVGQQNVALGYEALRNLGNASYNVAIGTYTGADKVSGDRNIYIGHGIGAYFNNTESNTIRIGDPNNGYGSNYSRFFAGGIRGVTTGQADAVAVVIDSNGQLGTINSSRRYKDDIRDMGDASSGLMRLRPVTYRYTQAYADGSRPIDYGLIAEEVEQVYPDLVAHLADGQVETVQYHKINAMLLNEVQKQHRHIEALEARLAELERRLTQPSATGPHGRR